MNKNLIWLILIVPMMTFGTTKYVDNFAPDEGVGTINNPYNSVKSAFLKLNAGDTLFIRGTNSGEGQVYLEDVDLPISGKVSAPITVMNFENEVVVLSVFSQFNINKNYWCFGGIIFDDNNSLIPKMKLLGQHNRLRNCIFRKCNLKNFDITGRNKNLFEYCQVL